MVAGWHLARSESPHRSACHFPSVRLSAVLMADAAQKWRGCPIVGRLCYYLLQPPSWAERPEQPARTHSNMSRRVYVGGRALFDSARRGQPSPLRCIETPSVESRTFRESTVARPLAQVIVTVPVPTSGHDHRSTSFHYLRTMEPSRRRAAVSAELPLGPHRVRLRLRHLHRSEARTHPERCTMRSHDGSTGCEKLLCWSHEGGMSDRGGSSLFEERPLRSA